MHVFVTFYQISACSMHLIMRQTLLRISQTEKLLSQRMGVLESATHIGLHHRHKYGLKNLARRKNINNGFRNITISDRQYFILILYL